MTQGSGTRFVGTDVCSISSHFCQLQLQDCWSTRITQPGSRTWSPEILESKYRISSMTCIFTCMNSSETVEQIILAASTSSQWFPVILCSLFTSLIIPYWCPASQQKPLLRLLDLPDRHKPTCRQSFPRFLISWSLWWYFREQDMISQAVQTWTMNVEGLGFHTCGQLHSRLISHAIAM